MSTNDALPGQPYDHPADIIMGNCPKCKARVGFHCRACMQSGEFMTSCTCKLTVVVEQVRAEEERRSMERLGLVEPRGRYCPKGGQHLWVVISGVNGCVKCGEEAPGA
jgi:hypothetical protein